MTWEIRATRSEICWALAIRSDDEANAKQVGTDQGFCVRTVVGQAWECVWTVMLDGGQITIEGPFFDTKDSVMTITGGTGDYAGATGQMKLHAGTTKAPSTTSRTS